ncbi:MAG TPA: circularly permuted type 2 ATP-grasp protein [Candidatus Acidoferrales bacterium]|nr:circularly permuted type 2 ATP-grasp protein [Candidatus Acidoferrales bacterium]
MQGLLDGYLPDSAVFDEFADERGQPRSHYGPIAQSLSAIAESDIGHRLAQIDSTLLQRGVTFTVYSDARGTERVLPFDPLPRIIPANEWAHIAAGIEQRVRALNAFLHDIYHEQRIVFARKIPAEIVFSSKFYTREMIGLEPQGGVYIHVSGIDLIRDGTGEYLVLEDNLRTPSGIAYVLENREILKRTFPQFFRDYVPRPVDDYPSRLRDALTNVAPAGIDDPTIVILTPGIYNSAYFEHALLARRMGVELVEGQDLVVHDNIVYMKTTKGLARVDVIYRRIDDDFLDPLYFRPDSALGAAGIFDSYRAGNVTLANAVGTGVADDKAVYPHVPEMIRYYLGEEPLLPNVQTYDLTVPSQRRHVIDNLERLVVKRTAASGGYGMLIGPASTKSEREVFADAIEQHPRDFIAQPVIELSSHPTLIESDIAPRRIDLRPFVLYGSAIDCPPAALTRVALESGSLVVNSSQGGGSKDTWILC